MTAEIVDFRSRERVALEHDYETFFMESVRQIKKAVLIAEEYESQGFGEIPSLRQKAAEGGAS